MRTGHYGNNQDVFITCRMRTRGADRQVFRGLRTRRYGAVSAAPAALPGGAAAGPGLHGDTCLHGMYLPSRAAITCACHTCLHGPYLHMSHLLAHATPACTGCTCLPRAIPLPPHTTPSCTCHACLHGPRCLHPATNAARPMTPACGRRSRTASDSTSYSHGRPTTTFWPESRRVPTSKAPAPIRSEPRG